MEQKDYLLREIEKIGLMLAAIWQKLFGGKENLAITLEQQIGEAKGMLLNEINFDLNHFLTLNEEESNEYINSFKGFTIENIESLAKLIAQIGFSDESENGKKYLEKALQLYEFCNMNDKTYSLEREMKVKEIISNQEKDVFFENPWLKWAIELQFIAQAGLTYSKDSFDLMRFERIREISAEIMSLKSGLNMEHVKEVFCNETGFQTPKLDTRAAIFRDNKILLVKEKNEKWSLPGGWVDVHDSIKSSTIKEVKEESGFNAIPLRLIAIQDRNKHNLPMYAYGICKVFVLCEITDGEFEPNNETVKRDFFDLASLPLLATEKNTKEQIELCFQAYKSDNWETVFD